MTTTQDIDALVAAVLEDQGDEATRLVLSDALEEAGRDKAARLVRNLRAFIARTEDGRIVRRRVYAVADDYNTVETTTQDNAWGEALAIARGWFEMRTPSLSVEMTLDDANAVLWECWGHEAPEIREVFANE